MKSECDSDEEKNLTIAIDSISNNNSNDNLNNDSFKICSDSTTERLWESKAMGCNGPEEILVAIWFFITHYFGLSSRIDHAKLCVGHIEIIYENQTKKLIFNKDFQPKTFFNTRFPAKPITELKSDCSRCPVKIYETYLSRRPSNFCYSNAPLYLQPDKSVQIQNDDEQDSSVVPPWFSAAGLGKNRIGSLFNTALVKSGQPSQRHYVSRRQMSCPTPNQTLPETNIKSENLTIKSDVMETPTLPKIRIKISHLNSGNPVVTETVDFQSTHEDKNNEKTLKKKSIDKEEVIEKKKIKTEKMSEDYWDDKDFSIELKIQAARNMGKSTKRDWRLQKSIIMVTSNESDPVLRQVMMQLGMMKELLPSDYKIRRQFRKKPSNLECDKRKLRNSLKNASSTSIIDKISFLKSELWPELDERFFDADMRKLMSYSFEIQDSEDNNEEEHSESKDLNLIDESNINTLIKT